MSVRPIENASTSPIHALQGLELEPPAIDASVITRLFYQLAKSSDYSAKMRQNFNGHYHLNLKQGKNLAADIKSNNYKQAGLHLGTAVLAIGVGIMAGKAGVDASSAISVATKIGEGGASGLRGSETWMSSEKQLVDQRISKGADAGKRVNDFYQQFMQAVRAFMEQQSQQNRPLGS